jgi:hypothetical protein
VCVCVCVCVRVCRCVRVAPLITSTYGHVARDRRSLAVAKADYRHMRGGGVSYVTERQRIVCLVGSSSSSGGGVHHPFCCRPRRVHVLMSPDTRIHNREVTPNDALFAPRVCDASPTFARVGHFFRFLIRRVSRDERSTDRRPRVLVVFSLIHDRV